MRNRVCFSKRVFAAVISFVLVSLILLSVPVPARNVHAAETNVKKNVQTHDIAIVFDNSLSMYAETDRWSQALYAIGVFASMLDYDAGDKLGIYPMSEISVGKSGAPSADRLEITKNNIKDISKIYSKYTSPTIVRPAYTAQQYLQASSADEKWLIVMTDGEFYYDKSTSEKREKKSAEWLNKKMMEFASGDIKVQYLGFGEASVLNSNISAGFYASNVNTADLLAGELVNICNKIFQRNEIHDISDEQFEIGVSMNSVVAFAQGKGAKIKSLTGPDGKKVKAVIDEKVSAGTEGTGEKDDDGNPYIVPVADVSGQVVTFAPCAAGKYKLDYEGSDVQVFYEPNVKVAAFLTDAEGNKIEDLTKVEPGDYQVHYGLFDGVTGEDVSERSELQPIEYHAMLNNAGGQQELQSGETIQIDADPNTSVDILVSYLNQYEIEDSFGFGVKLPEESVLKTRIDGSRVLRTPDRDKWEPFKVNVTLDGKPLSDDELAALTTEFTFSDGTAPVVKIDSGNSAYLVEYGKNEDGSQSDVETGSVTLNTKISTQDRFEREIVSEERHLFVVSGIPGWLPGVIVFISILGVIALIAFILTRKVLPKGVSMGNGSQITIGAHVDPQEPDAPTYTRRGLFKSTGTLGIHMPSVPVTQEVVSSCSANFSIEAVDRIYKKSPTRRIRIVGISSDCDSITINGVQYDSQDGSFVLDENHYPVIGNGQIDLTKNVNTGRGRKRDLNLNYIIHRR